LPQEEIAGDIADIVQHCLRMAADVVERRPVDAEAFGRLRESAAQRADEGVPLEAIVSAYQLGMAMCWERLSAGAGPDDLKALQEALGHVFEVQRQMVVAATTAYMEARKLLDGQDQEDRHAEMVALLAGEPADRTRPGSARLYVALTVVLARHPDESGTGVRAGIAARRKIRRARTVLDRFGTGPALAELDGSGGTVLLPVETRPAWRDLCQLLQRAAASADVAITAAAGDSRRCHAEHGDHRVGASDRPPAGPVPAPGRASRLPAQPAERGDSRSRGRPLAAGPQARATAHAGDPFATRTRPACHRRRSARAPQHRRLSSAAH
jgi:hypothetical protein